MNDRERLEMLEIALDDLSEMCRDHVLLIEGLKDRSALERLIDRFECIMVQREGGPLKAAERLHQSDWKAIIFTDWDNKGEHLADELEHHLGALGVEYDSKLRIRFADLCRKDIKDVESLDSLYARLCATY